MSSTFYNVLQKYTKTENNIIKAHIIGAMDGVSHDTIKDFISYNNWEIVFVEPIDFYIEKIKQNFGNSQRFRYVNKAISNKNGHEHWIMFDPTAIDSTRINNGMAGLSTIYPPKNCLKGFKDSGEYNDVLIEKEIECITVQTLLKMTFIPNYLQIDTEGYDWLILNQFEHCISDINFIKVEYSSLTNIEMDELTSFLDKNSFIYDKGSEDIFAIKKEILNEYI